MSIRSLSQICVEAVDLNSVSKEEIASLPPELMEQLFARISTLGQLEKFASPLVTRINFSKNAHLQLKWVEALNDLFPNLTELDMRGCQLFENACVGSSLAQLKQLKLIKLTRSDFSVDNVLRWFFDDEGHSKGLRIEMYDAVARRGILASALNRAECGSRLRGEQNRARINKQWNIVYDLIENYSWHPDEIRSILVQNCTSRDPRILALRAAAAKVLPKEMLQIQVRILGSTGGNPSKVSEDGVFLFSYPKLF